MSLDLFELQAFPNHEQQKDTIDNYFDTQLLWVDIKKYCAKNNLSEKITVSGFGGLFETANQDFREKVRKFNNSIFYLTTSIFRFTNYYRLWKECSEKERKTYLCIWCRYEARNVCNEIFMYEEKVKNLLRSLFALDPQQTRRNDAFMKELQKIATTNPLVKTFCDEISNYLKDPDVTFVTNIRNDEIHNDSPLDEFTDIVQYSPTRWAITKPYYVVNNQTLYEKIKKCLEALLHITNALQDIIDNFEVKSSS